MREAIRTELNRMCKLLPQNPPEEVAERLRARGFLSKDALIYSIGYYSDPMCDGRRTKSVKVKCSHCGDEAYLEYMPIDNECCHRYGGPPDRYGFRDISTGELVWSGQNATCPSCFRRCVAIGAARIGKRESYEIDGDHILTIHNVGGHLTVLGWKVRKCVRKDASIAYGADKMQGVAVIGKTVVRFAGCQHNYSNAITFYANWQPRYTYEDKFSSFDRMHIFVDSPKTVESTDAGNSALDIYVDTCNVSYPVQYLRMWCQYPQIENLVRQGCQHIISDVIEKCTVHYGWYVQKEKCEVNKINCYIGIEEVKPHLMLGIEKTEMPIARAFGFDALRFYRDVKNAHGIRLTPEQLRAAEMAKLHDVRELLCTYNAPVLRTLNYFDKHLHKPYGIKIDARYLIDYWESLKIIYGEVPTALRFPKDLRFAHDKSAKMIAEKTDELINAGITRRAEYLKLYSYTDETVDLTIRPCANQDELIFEGKSLDHCVARYANAIAKGNTSIFFIRKLSNPDVPYYTLEYKNGEISQNRGYKNQDPCEEVVIFANKWLKFANELNTVQKSTKIAVNL